jgi:hypothetical protein
VSIFAAISIASHASIAGQCRQSVQSICDEVSASTMQLAQLRSRFAAPKASIAVPVIALAASLARNRATSAISLASIA